MIVFKIYQKLSDLRIRFRTIALLQFYSFLYQIRPTNQNFSQNPNRISSRALINDSGLSSFLSKTMPRPGKETNPGPICIPGQTQNSVPFSSKKEPQSALKPALPTQDSTVPGQKTKTKKRRSICRAEISYSKLSPSAQRLLSPLRLFFPVVDGAATTSARRVETKAFNGRQKFPGRYLKSRLIFSSFLRRLVTRAFVRPDYEQKEGIRRLPRARLPGLASDANQSFVLVLLRLIRDSASRFRARVREGNLLARHRPLNFEPANYLAGLIVNRGHGINPLNGAVVRLVCRLSTPLLMLLLASYLAERPPRGQVLAAVTAPCFNSVRGHLRR